ncbi:MAG: hypothetical protein ACEQSR_08265 [Candidatus Methylacidiphilales bacterium]
MDTSKNYFIRSKGKGEFITFHLISSDVFEMLDVFFNTELAAKQYAEKKQLTIIDYTEKFELEEIGK